MEPTPQVIVTDIRMPPTFQDEGIEAAKEVRRRHPGPASWCSRQYDEPEYAVALLADGAAGYAYLLKDRVADGDQLGRAIREVATGGSMLDPEIVAALVSPARAEGDLSPQDEDLLQQVAEGRPVKAIAVSRADARRRRSNDAVEQLFLTLARGASAGRAERAAPAADAARGDRATARSRARRSPGCCRAGWPRSCAPTA